MIIERLTKKIPMPEYKTSGAAGIDLSYRAVFPDVFDSDENEFVFYTGVRIKIPGGHVGFLLPRSSVGKAYGMRLLNTIGVIDSDYTGEIMACVTFDKTFESFPEVGERLFQLIILPAPQFMIIEGVMPETERGDGGFGSTGK